MDFQPTAQPSWPGAGFGWSRRARLDWRAWPGGWGWRGRRKPVLGLAAASMPRTPVIPPARPLTHSGGCACHGKKKEEQEQKRHCGWLVRSLSAGKGSDPYLFDLTDLIHAWRGSTCVDQGRHLPGIAIYQPSPGNCRRRRGVGWGCPRHGCRGQAPRDGFTASPPSDTSPPPHGTPQSRFGFGFGSAGAGRSPVKCSRLRRPHFLYFSLISRRRSSRKPWAVIGSGYRLGFSGVMHEGSTSIRKSGFGCRKNGTE